MVVVTIAVGTAVALAILVWGTLRQIKVVSRSLQALAEAVADPMGAIRADTAEAQRRLEAVSERRAQMRDRRAGAAAGPAGGEEDAEGSRSNPGDRLPE